jgi:hypothetical protein
VSRQYFEDAPYADVQIASATAITSTAAENALVAVAQYTPVPASDARAGKVYKLTMGGIYSTSASASTLTLTPRWGTSSSGTTFGASVAQTVPASLTNEPWFLQAYVFLRTVNNGSATQSTAMCHGCFWGGGTAGTANSGLIVPFGGTSGTIDTTTAQGLWIGWLLSVAGSCTPQSCLWQSCN